MRSSLGSIGRSASGCCCGRCCGRCGCSSEGRPDPHVFVVFVLGVVLTRSAGCAINDFADRNFDRHVARTRNRPLVTGQVDPIEALALCAGSG